MDSRSTPEDDDVSRNDGVRIAGTWLVTRIEVGQSELIAVPRDVAARFEIDEVDQTVEAYLASSGYSCRFERALNDLSLRSCLASGNVPVYPSRSDVSLARVAARAFRTRTMSVSQDSSDTLTIRMGDVTFRTVASP
jgi:hypothetical protein